MIGEGEGFSGEAKENAYRSVFEQLLKRQEDARKHKKSCKISAKKVRETPIPILNSQISNPVTAHDSSSRLKLENVDQPLFDKSKRKRQKKTAQQVTTIETPTE